MSFTEQAKNLVQKGDIKEASTNILEDTINAILGDPISIGKIMVAIVKGPFFIREQLFWTKLEAFLNGVYLDSDDCEKLRVKLTECGEKDDNPRRLIECIDRSETQQKIRYLINATRCLLTDFIDLDTYFRICHAITHTLEEDLCYLRNNIKNSDLPYNQFTQGLLSAGLMYQSVIDGNGDQKYSFTPIAEIVNKFAVSYDDTDRYPNSTTKASQGEVPQPSVFLMEWQSF